MSDPEINCRTIFADHKSCPLIAVFPVAIDSTGNLSEKQHAHSLIGYTRFQTMVVHFSQSRDVIESAAEGIGVWWLKLGVGWLGLV